MIIIFLVNHHKCIIIIIISVLLGRQGRLKEMQVLDYLQGESKVRGSRIKAIASWFITPESEYIRL